MVNSKLTYRTFRVRSFGIICPMTEPGEIQVAAMGRCGVAGHYLEFRFKIEHPLNKSDFDASVPEFQRDFMGFLSHGI